MGSQLVAYSGFSNTNYIREQYSSDLDFGTGDWSVGSWLNTSNPNINANFWPNPETALGVTAIAIQSNVETAPNGTLTADKLVPTNTNEPHFGGASFTAPASSFVVSFYAKKAGYNFITLGGGSNDWNSWARAIFDLNTGACKIVTSGYGVVSNPSMQDVFGDGSWWRCSVTVSGTGQVFYGPAPTYNSNNTFLGDGTSGVFVWGVQVNLGTIAGTYTPGQTAIYNPRPGARIVSRSYSSGASIDLSIDGYGYLTATVNDGTNSRTVTTDAAYNTGTWVKAEAIYKSGKLAILINGVEVKSTVGAPLLTLNNSNAVLTIGNSYDLTAPFPGSLALLKLSATVPTAEQSLWMYNQEKQMFQPGAQVTLPDSNAIQDLSYDDLTDTWVAASTTNISYWNGLVRTNTTAVPAGTYSKLVSGSGIHLSARGTTNQGVDITIPDYSIRTKVKKKAEKSKQKSVAVFDYTPVVFTSAVLNGTNVMTCSTVSGTPYIGMTISGTGITAGTTIQGINGTTYYLSTTATAGTVTVGQTSFDLPVGYTATIVYSNGLVQREASNKNYTRQFDGFKETIVFGTSPGTSPVQIHAQLV